MDEQRDMDVCDQSDDSRGLPPPGKRHVSTWPMPPGSSERDSQGGGWRAHTQQQDWMPPRRIPHYDADVDEHHPEVDVTAEYALWRAYVRSGSRIASTDIDIVFDDVVAFAGDFIDDDAYYEMESLEPGLDRRRWVVVQPHAVQSDRARRSRLATVIGDALEREDSDLGGSDDDNGADHKDDSALALGDQMSSDDAASSHSC